MNFNGSLLFAELLTLILCRLLCLVQRDVCICVSVCSDANIERCRTLGAHVFWDIAAAPVDAASLAARDSQVHARSIVLD